MLEETDCLGVFGCSCREVIMTAICSWLGHAMMTCSSDVKSVRTSWRNEMKQDMTLFWMAEKCKKCTVVLKYV